MASLEEKRSVCHSLITAGEVRNVMDTEQLVLGRSRAEQDRM